MLTGSLAEYDQIGNWRDDKSLKQKGSVSMPATAIGEWEAILLPDHSIFCNIEIIVTPVS